MLSQQWPCSGGAASTTTLSNRVPAVLTCACDSASTIKPDRTTALPDAFTSCDGTSKSSATLVAYTGNEGVGVKRGFGLEDFNLAATVVEQPGFVQQPYDLNYFYAQEQDVSPTTWPDVTVTRDQPQASTETYNLKGDGSSRPAKRNKRASAATAARHKPTEDKNSGALVMDDNHVKGRAAANDASNEAAASASKPKRVRTGCLTCRGRHLKCDEALPNCNNCRKSNRTCRRGMKLNFIDMKVQAPPVVPPSMEWNVNFIDESRDIASEYKGGLGKYADITPEPASELPQAENGVTFDFSAPVPPPPALAHQSLPSIQGMVPGPYGEDAQNAFFEQHRDVKPQLASSASGSTLSANEGPPPHTSYSNSEETLTPKSETREYLTNPEEVLFMQVFVEEIGLWMDSMDPMKHFSRILPFHSLQEPMLLNAFLACGARHLTLVNPAYTEDRALYYYDTATTWLLRSLQNPDRDTVICATTAVILNVYEVMSEKPLQRMNHIAGARALVKECGWNARSSGIGAACFWLNVGMEILSCLHFNWQVAWDPEDWGVDMDLSRETQSGREELWTYRVLYIVAKVCNFRATIPRFQEASPRNVRNRLQNRYAEYVRLRELADTWNENIPRTMHPMAFLYPYQTTTKSAFPEVYLIKRTSITARLFYHTAMCLLAQINPLQSKDVGEMHDLLQLHAHQICGIVAHVKDRGVASVAIRSLAIAGEALFVRREQEEVLQIFEKIRTETGWKVGFLKKELPEKWGWEENPPPPPQQQYAPSQSLQDGMLQQQQPMAMAPLQVPPIQMGNYQQLQPTLQPLQQQQHQQPSATSLPPAPPPGPPPVTSAAASAGLSNLMRLRGTGMLNPLLATADFTMPQHPYQAYYVAPNQIPNHHTTHYPF